MKDCTKNNIPFFSVVIPVYNRGLFIGKTLDSVLNQSCNDFEIICINDGSSDNTQDVIEDYQKEDKRIKLHSFQDNKGRCIARNKGISIAKGKWICFLDSDDYYLANHLSVLNKLVEKHPNFFAFSASQKRQNSASSAVFNNGRILKLKDFVRSNPTQLNQLCINIGHCPKFANERIPISEDWLFMRQLTHQLEVYCTDVVTNVLVDHDNRSVNTTNWNEFAKWNIYTGTLFSKTKDLPESTKNKILSFTYLLAANILLSKSLKQESWKYFRKSLRYISSYTDALFYKGLIKYIIK
jgi:glycosyltransferase involved in cell wall biosynthesis